MLNCNPPRMPIRTPCIHLHLHQRNWVSHNKNNPLRTHQNVPNKYLFWHDVEFVLDNYYLTDIERKILEQISVKKTKKIPNFPQLYLKGILPKISKDFDHEDFKLSNFIYCGDLNGQFKVLLIDPLLPSDYA